MRNRMDATARIAVNGRGRVDREGSKKGWRRREDCGRGGGIGVEMVSS